MDLYRFFVVRNNFLCLVVGIGSWHIFHQQSLFNFNDLTVFDLCYCRMICFRPCEKSWKRSWQTKINTMFLMQGGGDVLLQMSQ